MFTICIVIKVYMMVIRTVAGFCVRKEQCMFPLTGDNVCGVRNAFISKVVIATILYSKLCIACWMVSHACIKTVFVVAGKLF